MKLVPRKGPDPTSVDPLGPRRGEVRDIRREVVVRPTKWIATPWPEVGKLELT